MEPDQSRANDQRIDFILRNRRLALFLHLSQVWSQWEEDSAWSDSLLRGVETSFPIMHTEVDSEEQMLEKLSGYQVILVNERLPQTLRVGGHFVHAPFGSFGDYWARSPRCTLCMALKT